MQGSVQVPSADGRAPGTSAAAAGPRHPGRVAPDIGAAGHDGRPVRVGARRPVRARGRRRPAGAAEDRGVDGHRAPGRGPDPGAVRAVRNAGLPASRLRPPRFLLRAHQARGPRAGPALSRRRGAGAQPQGADAPRLAGAAGRGRAGLPRRRRAREPRQPRRPVHDRARLLQQPARTGRGAAHPGGRRSATPSGSTASAGASASRTACSATAGRSRTWWS